MTQSRPQQPPRLLRLRARYNREPPREPAPRQALAQTRSISPRLPAMWQHRFPRWPAKSKTMVRTVRLSDYITEDVDLLKLDVEGSEMAILEDLMAAGKLERVRQIIGEYHHHVKPDEDRLGEFLSLLERAGFGYHLCAALPLPFPQRQEI